MPAIENLWLGEKQ